MKKNILLILISIFLSIILILSGFRLIIFNENLYKKEFNKYNIYSNFDSKNVVDKNLNLLINYLKNKDSKLETDFFNKKEKVHLNDVKNLIQKLIFLFYSFITLLILIISYFIYKKRYKFILKFLILASVFTMFFILMFYLLILFNFDDTFTYFHLISFDNNIWLLDPETDNLIKMFPQEIFFDMTKIAIFYSFFISFVILIISYLFLKKFLVK